VRGLTRVDDQPWFAAAIAAIDAANALDPTITTVRGSAQPLALAHGVLAQQWVERLAPDADDALRLAARAHHLRRWELARASYPDGRAGYLRWRRDQKARHASDVAAIMVGAGYEAAAIERTQRLIRREGLGTDGEAQVVEDAACLVFIETQLASFAGRLERDHVLEIVRKTARKMSVDAMGLVAELPLDDTARQVLADALSA
jgi:hypothetical protein